MSWFNQVKFFYTSTIALLITFIWTIIMSIAFKENISFQLFFLIVVMSNIGRYLLRLGNNPKLCLALSVIPIALIEFLTSSEPFFAIINIIFSSALILKLFKEEKDDINYDEYKRIFLHGIYYIFATGIIYNFMRWSGFRSQGSMIYIGILVYIILVVISLREAMGYEYQIRRTRGSKYINYGLSLFGILLTQDAVYSKIMFVGEIIASMVANVIDFLANIIFSVLQYPLMWLYSLIDRLFAGAKGELPKSLIDLGAVTQDIQAQRVTGDGKVIVNIIIAILFLLIIYFLYRSINKVYYRANKNKSQEYTEFVEDIEKQTIKKDKIFAKLKKLFRKKGSPREEIIYKYGELVDTAAKKDIFKEYMTPGQLKHVIKIKVDPSERINEVTNIYNEAKFSQHMIENKEWKSMEENVNKLNKIMK